MRYLARAFSFLGEGAVRDSGEVQFVEIEFGRFQSKHQCWESEEQEWEDTVLSKLRKGSERVLFLNIPKEYIILKSSERALFPEVLNECCSERIEFPDKIIFPASVNFI